MKEFFASLKKSTKITLISCASFIALTLLILVFFVLFPITPSEKVIASFGRESVARKNAESSVTVTTVAATSDVVVSRVVTTTAYDPTVSRTNYKITVTTGEGFFSGGYITTGTYSENTEEDDPYAGMWTEPEEDPYYPLPNETTTYYEGDNPTTTTGPYIGDPSIVTEPSTEPVENPTEPATSPVVEPTEPVEPATNVPSENGDDSGTAE